jgi:hypothetical protein
VPTARLPPPEPLCDPISEQEGEEGREEDVLGLDDLDRTGKQGGREGAAPASFLLLEEKHFPAFVTYQGLLEMLDAALLEPFLSRDKEERRTQMVLKHVSGRTFIDKYWSHLDQTLARRLAPGKVWTQICTHIKGSFASAEKGRSLEEAEYLALVLRRRQEEEAEVRGDEGCSKERRDATSTAVSREEALRTYAMFRSYEQLKARNGEWDQCDLVLHVHARLGRHDVSTGVEWPRVDRIYVDEVSHRICSLLSRVVLSQSVALPGLMVLVVVVVGGRLYDCRYRT